MAKAIENKFEHSILLDDISTDDMDTGTNDQYPNAATKSERSLKASESFGYDSPLIQINDYVFTGTGDILNFEIDSSGFIPRCIATFAIVENSFISKSLPKDGDLMSVFLTSKIEDFNPIRNDYLITNVQSGESHDPEGNSIRLTISGELWIPKLDSEICKSFSGTSLGVLEEIARELNLGFSTNTTASDDDQKWLATYDTYRDHINYITAHSWNNEESFFTSYIDVYYTLNFVEVNEQLKPHNEFLPAISTVVNPPNNYQGQTGVVEDDQLIFSNYKDQGNSNFYIQKFRLTNNAGRINRSNGYIKDVKFYDFANVTDETFTLEPMITAGSESKKIVPKGRPGEDFYKEQKKTKFLGVLFNGDEYQMHKNYHYAKVHNMMNNSELGKLNMIIITPHMNFNIHKYQNVECAFVVQNNRARANELLTDESMGNQEPVLDNFYSGAYLIKGLKIRYSLKRGFMSEFIMARREWPVPDDPDSVK